MENNMNNNLYPMDKPVKEDLFIKYKLDAVSVAERILEFIEREA